MTLAEHVNPITAREVPLRPFDEARRRRADDGRWSSMAAILGTRREEIAIITECDPDKEQYLAGILLQALELGEARGLARAALPAEDV